MTTQAVKAVVGSKNWSKIFDLTATDGQWGNVLLDTVSDQPIGILVPNQIVTNIQANYAAGCGAWRVQNSQSLMVSARGFASKIGYNNYESTSIKPIKINPNDIIEMYTLPMDTDAGDTNVLAFVKTTKGELLYKCNTTADDTATEMTTAVNGLSLGSDAFGATLTNLDIQCEDGAQLSYAQVVDNTGGVVWTGYGSFRGSTGGSRSDQTNASFSGLAIPIARGYKVQVATVTG